MERKPVARNVRHFEVREQTLNSQLTTLVICCDRIGHNHDGYFVIASYQCEAVRFANS
jgi:hypothetical protein